MLEETSSSVPKEFRKGYDDTKVLAELDVWLAKAKEMNLSPETVNCKPEENCLLKGGLLDGFLPRPTVPYTNEELLTAEEKLFADLSVVEKLPNGTNKDKYREVFLKYYAKITQSPLVADAKTDDLYYDLFKSERVDTVGIGDPRQFARDMWWILYASMNSRVLISWEAAGTESINTTIGPDGKIVQFPYVSTRKRLVLCLRHNELAVESCAYGSCVNDKSKKGVPLPGKQTVPEPANHDDAKVASQDINQTTHVTRAAGNGEPTGRGAGTTETGPVQPVDSATGSPAPRPADMPVTPPAAAGAPAPAATPGPEHKPCADGSTPVNGTCTTGAPPAGAAPITPPTSTPLTGGTANGTVGRPGSATTSSSAPTTTAPASAVTGAGAGSSSGAQAPTDD